MANASGERRSGNKLASKTSGQPKKPETPEYVVKYPHLRNEHYTEHQIHAYADEALAYMERNTQETWIWTYFIQQRIPKTTVKRFIAGNEYFAQIWALVKDISEIRMFKFGTNRDYNGSMYIFAMKNCHGWRDNPDTETDDDDTIVGFTGWSDEKTV